MSEDRTHCQGAKIEKAKAEYFNAEMEIGRVIHWPLVYMVAGAIFAPLR